MTDDKNKVTPVLKIPMRPIGLDAEGQPRFQPNVIVRRLLDEARSRGFNLNHLYALFHEPTPDWDEFYQLIGYSVSGYGELDVVSPESIKEADDIADALVENRGGS